MAVTVKLLLNILFVLKKEKRETKLHLLPNVIVNGKNYIFMSDKIYVVISTNV